MQKHCDVMKQLWFYFGNMFYLLRQARRFTFLTESLYLFKDCLRISLLILSEFKRLNLINFYQPSNHQKTYGVSLMLLLPSVQSLDSDKTCILFLENESVSLMSQNQMSNQLRIILQTVRLQIGNNGSCTLCVVMISTSIKCFKSIYKNLATGVALRKVVSMPTPSSQRKKILGKCKFLKDLEFGSGE